MAEMRFKPTELFGGAMTAEVPEGFGDVRYARAIFYLDQAPVLTLRSSLFDRGNI